MTTKFTALLVNVMQWTCAVQTSTTVYIGCTRIRILLSINLVTPYTWMECGIVVCGLNINTTIYV